MCVIVIIMMGAPSNYTSEPETYQAECDSTNNSEDVATRTTAIDQPTKIYLEIGKEIENYNAIIQKSRTILSKLSEYFPRGWNLNVQPKTDWEKLGPTYACKDTQLPRLSELKRHLLMWEYRVEEADKYLNEYIRTLKFYEKHLSPAAQSQMDVDVAFNYLEL